MLESSEVKRSAPMVPESPITLYLLRHAEVDARYHRVFSGRLDIALSEQGRDQALKMAEYLASHHFDGLYASPLKRVQETLEPLSRNDGVPLWTRAEFQEVDFGAWTGLSWREVWEHHQASAYDWLDMLEAETIPDAETAHSFRSRVTDGLRHILQHHQGQTIGIVCHGGVIRMALAIILDLPLAKMRAFDIEYASITQVSWHPEKTEVQLLNFAPWRDLKS